MKRKSILHLQGGKPVCAPGQQRLQLGGRTYWLHREGSKPAQEPLLSLKIRLQQALHWWG